MFERSQYALLGEKRFGPFFVTQFLGAFNDNVFKNALLLLIAFHAADRFTASSDTLINLSAGLFVLPFFLFSSIAGQLADKYDKAMLIRRIKALEIVIMLGAALALWFDAITVLIALLFLMGSQSSLFGPLKYGIIPQTVSAQELLGANGLVETGTFLAILLGTALGGFLIGFDSLGRAFVGAAVVLFAVLGYLSSLPIPHAPPVAPQLQINWNPFTETWRMLAYAWRNRMVFAAIAGISWFWFLGSIYLAQLPNFTRLYLGGDERVVTLLLAVFSIGVGAGSLLCERLTGRRVDVALVPFGALGLSIFGLDLASVTPVAAEAAVLGATVWLSSAGAWRVLLDILLLGIFGGFYIVPLYAVVQQRTEASRRARIIAANNVLNALLMVLAALLAILMLGRGYTIMNLFGLVAVLNALVAIVLCVAIPEFWQRFRLWITGRGNQPQ